MPSNNTFAFELDYMYSRLPQLASKGDNYLDWQAARTSVFQTLGYEMLSLIPDQDRRPLPTPRLPALQQTMKNGAETTLKLR